MSGNADAVLARLLDLHPKRIDLTLDRVRRLLSALGDPQESLKNVVHVAGTNGKGSTVAMIRAGLEGAGKTANVYTSPHLVRFRERIRLRGDLIDEGALSALLEECERVNAAAPITFFEITTAAAFLAMSRNPADFTLLETGLGGRLDATNVLTPKVAAVTPISMDHREWLGETLAEIAAEKAGILKPGAPCVVAPQESAARAAIEERAAEVGAPLLMGGRDWVSRRENGRLIYEDGDGRLDLPLPRLPGDHQAVNAGTALAVLRALGIGRDSTAASTAAPTAAPTAAMTAAMTNIEWPARMQRLRRGPLAARLPDGAELWLDGGHNAAAGAATADLLAEMHRAAPAPLWLIVGMIETKSPSDYLRPLAPLAEGLFAVAIPETPAGLSPQTLARAAGAAGRNAAPAGSVPEALDRILARSGARPPRILICGSLYLAGIVLRDWGGDENPERRA